MKKVLITGGRGFIAKHLESFLSKRGYSVALYDWDVTEKFEVPGPIDVICHLAAKTFIMDCAENPAETMRINFGGTLNALECARAKKAKFIFTSTAAVYGIPNEGISEEYLPKPDNAYGLSKYLAEQLCEFYAKSFDMPCLALRLFNVYGPGQNGKFLVPALIENVKNGQVVDLRSPKSVRDFIFIDDLISLFELCINSDIKDRFTVLNVGSGRGHSVMDVVNIIKSLSGKDVLLKCDENARGDVFTANINRAKKVLGWEPNVSFEEGLKKTLTRG